jgi:hypothetical protein
VTSAGDQETVGRLGRVDAGNKSVHIFTHKPSAHFRSVQKKKWPAQAETLQEVISNQ